MPEDNIRKEGNSTRSPGPMKSARRGWRVALGILLGLVLAASLGLNGVLLAALVRQAPERSWPGRARPTAPAAGPSPGAPAPEAANSDLSRTQVIEVVPGEIRPEIDAPGRSVRIRGQVIGRVRAGDVTVEQGGSVGGDIESTGRVRIEGTASGSVTATVVEVGSDPLEAVPSVPADLMPGLEAGSRGSVHGGVQATTVTVGPGGRVTGAVRATGPVEVWGRIDGNVSAERASLRGRAWVGGNVDVSEGVLELEPGATVAGQVRSGQGGLRLVTATAGSREPPSRLPAPAPAQPPVVVRSEGPWGRIVLGLGALLGTLSLVGLTYAFWPEAAEWVAGRIRTAPWRSLVTGLWTVVAVPAVAGGLAVTVIGIPVALLVLVAGVAAGLLGLAASGRVVGERLRRALQGSGSTPLAEVLGGAFAALLLLLVPVLGWLVFGVLALMGTGAAASYGYPRLLEAWHAWRRRRRSTCNPA